MKKILLSILFMPSILWAQQDFSGGLLPKINASFPLTDRLKLNSSLELRQQTFNQEEFSDRDIDFVLGDLANTFSYKLRTDQKLNFGYTLRERGGEWHHRTTQQLSIVQKKTFFRMGHRVGLDQTFFPKDKPVFRARYRLSIEKPLSGTEVDPSEFYVKINHEYLGIVSENNEDIEIRLIPYLGYEINRTSKLELGLDYRIGDFRASQNSHRLWLSMVYYVSF